MPTPTEVMADPQFLGLPDEEKTKVLNRIDPNFQKLAPPEQAKVIGRIGQPPPMAAPAAEPELSTPPQSTSFKTALTDAMKGVQIGSASLAEGLASAAGIPSDIAELAVNGLAWLGERERVRMGGAPVRPDQSNSVNLPMGSEELTNYLPDALRVPKDLPPTQALLSSALKWQGSALPFIGAAMKLLTYADPRKLAQMETLLAGGGGLGAEAFKQIYGPSPIGEFMSGLVAATGPQLAMGVLRKARSLVNDLAGLRTDQDIKKAIGTNLNTLSTPEEVGTGIQKAEDLQNKLGSEFKPTTAQATDSPGLTQAERSFQRSTTAQADTGKRTLGQNQAVVRSYLEKGAPEGKLSDTVNALESTRNRESAMMDAALIRQQAQLDAAKQRVTASTDRIITQADEKAAAAEDRAQTRVNALRTNGDGAVITEGDAGRILRDEYQAERTAFETEAEKRYDALPTFPVPTEGLKGDLNRLNKDFGVELQGPAAAGMAKVRAVIPETEAPQRAAGFTAAEPPPAAPAQTNFTDLRQARNEVRRLRRTSIASQDYKSSFQLGEIDDAIGKSLDDVKAAPPAGVDTAVDQLAQTDAWYGKNVQRLKAGEAGALRFKDKWGRFLTHDEDVAASFLKGETPMNDFVQAIGSRPSAQQALKDYARLDFYKKTVNPETGEIKQVAASKWLADHGDALKQFPDLSSEFTNAKSAQAMATDLRTQADALAKNPDKVARLQNPKVFGELDDATRKQTDLLDARDKSLGDWQKGLTSTLTGLDADRAAGAIIRSAKPQTAIAELSKKIGSDADGQAGLTRALWDASLDKFSAQITDAVGNRVLKYDKMRRFLNDNEGWMVSRFGQDRVDRMKTSMQALQMLESTGRPVLPGGSDTMANLSNVLTDWGPFLSRLYAERSGRASLKWVLSERAARLLGNVVKGRTEDAAAEMLNQAFYDPRVAQTFMLAAKQDVSAPLLQKRFAQILPKSYLVADHSGDAE